jgi:hypothetical protein
MFGWKVRRSGSKVIYNHHADLDTAITHLTFDGRHGIFEFWAHIHPVDDLRPFVCGGLDRIEHCAVHDDRPHRPRSGIIFQWHSKSADKVRHRNTAIEQKPHSSFLNH